MTHIFVALGQSHINNFETLLTHQCIHQGTFVLVAPHGVSVNNSLWHTTFIADSSFDNQAKGRFQQISAILAKTKEYRQIIQKLAGYKNNPVTIYVAYIEDILSNYLFFSYKKDASIVIVEDGTLNYYDHTLKNISSIKFTLKQVISAFRGIRFRKYKGHSSGASDPRVEAQYLTLPHEAFVPKKAKQLPLKTFHIETLSNDLYIVGQEAFGSIIGQELFIEELSSYFRLLREQPFYQEVSIIYYKPHRNGVRITSDFIQEFFPEKEIRIMHSKKTSEMLYFEELTCKYISSFNSSTLINIYAAMKDSTRATVICYVYPLMTDELTILFKKLNFKFLKE
jgi:hypothetical protein